MSRYPAQRTREDVETIAQLMHRHRVTSIARRIGRTPTAVRKLMERHHLAPTRDAGYLTPHCLSREYVALSPQSLTAKCRSGEIPAHRNPARTFRRASGGPRWWLISLDLVPQLQARYGARPGSAVQWSATSRQRRPRCTAV